MQGGASRPTDRTRHAHMAWSEKRHSDGSRNRDTSEGSTLTSSDGCIASSSRAGPDSALQRSKLSQTLLGVPEAYQAGAAPVTPWSGL